jgi:hypothetical protein
VDVSVFFLFIGPFSPPFCHHPHRAHLGVYLRLNGISIPGMYGPSADEHTTTAQGHSYPIANEASPWPSV